MWTEVAGRQVVQQRQEHGEHALRVRRAQPRSGGRGSPGSAVGPAAALQGQVAPCRQEVAGGAAPRSCSAGVGGAERPGKTRDPLRALPRLLASAGRRPQLRQDGKGGRV